MQRAIKVIDQIKNYYNACIKSNSEYLRNDYNKKIKSLKRDLKEYCSYKKLNYKKICSTYNI